ncbi:hypothetical protein AAVH_22090 [Aphelenchoides avenae]|nr:hypothetical protein AAVH_22090 [Aphelenchus avenae]
MREPIAVPMQFVATGENNGCYMVNVSIGTPAQHFRLTLDNEFIAIHVISKFVNNTATSCKATEIKRSLFDQRYSDQRIKSAIARFSASKTYVRNSIDEGEGGGPPGYRPYEDPRCAKDVFGFKANGFNDTLQIGSFRRPSTAVILITSVAAPLNPQWTADGWFGIQMLGWRATADTLDTLLTDFQHPQITLYYDRVEAADDKDGGILTLGGADTKNCDSRWVSVVNASSMYSAYPFWPLYFEK